MSMGYTLRGHARMACSHVSASAKLPRYGPIKEVAPVRKHCHSIDAIASAAADSATLEDGSARLGYGTHA
jgi:hypothetical protein